jgi:hypothetical protein
LPPCLIAFTPSFLRARASVPLVTPASDADFSTVLAGTGPSASSERRTSHAYDDFCRWARTQRIEPCSETRFGTDFTFRVGDLGGRKVKRRDRAYYVGVALSEAQTPPLLKVAA